LRAAETAIQMATEPAPHENPERLRIVALRPGVNMRKYRLESVCARTPVASPTTSSDGRRTTFPCEKASITKPADASAPDSTKPARADL
jgi:hypothetical protein